MTECLEWDGLRDKDGYGLRYVPAERQYRRVHRLVWAEQNGPIPAGGMILHKCDNPPCYDLDHLYLGDGWDNARDKSDRGRIAGAKNPNARVTLEQVHEMRVRYSEGNARLKDLSELYGIRISTVSKIIRNESWKEPSNV